MASNVPRQPLMGLRDPLLFWGGHKTLGDVEECSMHRAFDPVVVKQCL